MRLRPWLLALVAATLACNTLLPTATPTRAATRLAPSLAPPNQTVTTAATGTSAPLLTPLPAPSLTPAPSATAPPATAPTAAPTPLPAASPANSGLAGQARTCDYVPGVSVPAQLPSSLLTEGTPTPVPPPPLPTNTPVDAATNTRHLQVFHDLVSTIDQDYVYTDVIKTRVPALQQQYEALVAAGLTDDGFYEAMHDLINALGDDHSNFESPAEAAQTDAAFSGNNDFVGIGISVRAVPETGAAVIVLVFPGGPAAAAGLRSHDSITAVDGQPVLDANGAIRDVLRGPAGTSMVLTIQRPGQPSFKLTLQRQRITGPLPIDYCLMPAARVGYIYLPGLDDATIPDQVRAALRQLTAGGPLSGLVIDNRENGGGLATVLDDLLSLFTHGTLGQFVFRDQARQLVVTPQDVGGSQAVPLVVLVGEDTVSYGEVFSGLLQISGRAAVVGQRTLGNVETEWAYSFKDGSRVWLAHELFQPPGLPAGVWEGLGIAPDVKVPVRWDLFSEATDPALAAALARLHRQ